MQWFRNLSIKAKLIFLASVLSLMLVVTGVMGFLGVHMAKKAIANIYNHHITAIKDLNEVRNYQLQIQLELLSARLETDAFVIQEYNDRVDKLIFQIGTRLQDYGNKVADSEEKRLFDEYGAARMKMGVEGIVPMKDLLLAERFAEAGSHFSGNLVPLYKASSATLDSLIDYHVGAAGKAYEEISTLAASTEWTSIVTTLAGLLLSIALTFAVSLAISRNVSRLRSASESVAKGNLTARAGVCCNDELGAVGNSFDMMVTEFGSLIGQVNDSTERVTEEAQLLSNAAREVAEGSRQQISQAAAAASSAGNLDNAVRTVAERLAQVVTATDQAGTQVAHGQKVVNDAVRGIEDVARTVEESAGIIASLGQRSDEIGRIVQVIKDIADQTNLLALNAAIEAARAGEQGRGFAVVADEVRKLAERTTSATSEISSMIQAIQSETGQTVQIMERGSQQVSSGVSLANQAGQALGQISDAVKQVVGLIREINASSQAQASAADDIAHRVDDIAQAAQTNGASVAQVVSATQELRALSQTLEASVSRFRV